MTTTSRRARAESPVSVIVPCFNHGVFLEECLTSVQGQTHPAAEIIVVDDGSTDAYTLDVLSKVEDEGQAQVIRQPNSGPSAARNRAVEAATGALVLPLDADNRLAPTALASMKAALLAAPDQVRWVYPHQSFFGNRNDLIVMPEFNLWLLLVRNFCDTGSLIDRSVFEAGCRYREDIGLGHEDWDFFLGAVEHGFVGVPCHERVFFVRKHGFTRSDQVDQQLGSFAAEVRRLHPDLFAPANLLRVKQEWSPALSVVVDGPAGSIGDMLNGQSFQDFELVGRRREGGCFGSPAMGGGRLGDSHRLLRQAKGRWVLLWSGSHHQPLGDPAFVEKAVTVAEHADAPAAVAISASDGSEGTFNWRGCAPGDPATCIGLLLAGELLHDLLPALDAGSPSGPLEQLLAGATARRPVDWRSLASRPGVPDDIRHGNEDPLVGDAQRDDSAATEAEPTAGGASAAPVDPALAAASEALERQFRHREAAALHLGHEPITRPPCPPRGFEGDGWKALLTGGWENWAPEHTRSLVLSFDPVCFRWELGHGDAAQPCGYSVWIPLGRVFTYSFPGTIELWRQVDVRTGAVSYVLGQPADRQRCALLGFVSTAHLPGMVNLVDVVTSHLERLRMHSGGRPVADLTLVGDDTIACIEAVQPPPGGPVVAPVVPWPLWPLYEVAGRDGRVSYSTHPDAPAVAGGGRLQRAAAVARIAAPGRTENTLIEVVRHDTGARAYVNDPPEALPDGFAVSVVVGSLFTGPFTSTLPLVRLIAVTPGPHSAVSEPGHRLAAQGWEEALRAGTHQPEGIMGAVLGPDPNRSPLYRWRHRERFEWRYTLGAGVGEVSDDDWHFDGTIGLAFTPTVDWPTLVDLVELRHPVTGGLTYVCGDGPEARTHLFEQVVARLYRDHDDGVVPLFRLRGPGGETVHAVNPDELHDHGYRAEGPVAFVGMAIPPPSAEQPTLAEPGVRRITQTSSPAPVDGLVEETPAAGLLALVSDDDAGGVRVSHTPPPDGAEHTLGWICPRPFPWSIPLYELVERRTGRRVLSTDGELALAGSHGVLRVVAFLGSPAHGTATATMATAVQGPEASSRRSRRVLRLSLSHAARRGAAHLPPPARRTLRLAWRAVRCRIREPR